MHVSGSPEARTVGRLRVDVAVGPIARMFAAEDWQRPANVGGGAAVFTGLGLVPVARPRKGTTGLHYGNNVTLDPGGSYRVRVRLAPSALTGTDEPVSLEFGLDLGAAGE